MKTSPRAVASSLLSALTLLLAGTGCYNPKADIDAYRPQARKYLDDMTTMGKAITALPPLTQDTLHFPNPALLRFADGPGGAQNTAFLHLQELSDIGGFHIYDRLISNEFFNGAASLLRTGKDAYAGTGKVTKKLVDGRFRQLFAIEYLVVLRTGAHKSAMVTGAQEFEGGEIRGEAFLREVNNPEMDYGGISYASRNSELVNARVHANDAQQARIDRNHALRADMEKQSVQMIHQRLKERLPGTKMPDSW